MNVIVIAWSTRTDSNKSTRRTHAVNQPLNITHFPVERVFDILQLFWSLQRAGVSLMGRCCVSPILTEILRLEFLVADPDVGHQRS